MTEDRLHVLRNLLERTTRVDRATAELQLLPWDSTEVITLERRHIIDLLTDYLAGSISADDSAAWAEAVEVRDGIGRESGAEDLLNEVLFVLANPDINGSLTRESAEDWLRRLP